MPALVEQHKHPSSFTTRAVRPTTRQEHQTGTSNVGSKQLPFHVRFGSNQVLISLYLYPYPAANNSAGRNAHCGCWMNEIKAWGDRLDIRAASTTKSEAIDRRINS